MTDKYSQQESENKYQNKDVSSDTRIDDIEALKKKAAAMQEQKKQMAEQIGKLMDDTAKKAVPFKKEVSGKFKQQLVGILVMPPKQDKKLETETGKINDKLDILCLIELKDVSDIKSKLEKKQTIERKIKEIAKKKLPNHMINVVLLDEVWDMCLKGKFDILNILTIGKPIYDRGWVGALRMTEIHKMKVLQKFEKYVVAYVLAGSMARGEATEVSDVDTYIVIDDTDVTRMTSAELKSRLQGMIWGYAQEAAMAAGVKNILNVQVYILSDMWDSIKNANPVIVTFLRDGIPLYDRGMFTPWKQLLMKGKIKPTPEAITNYMKSGDQMVKRIEAKLKEIAIDDFYWAGTTPMQGALMLLGFPPPAPKELGAEIRKHLVKPGLIEEKHAKTWDAIFKIHKDIEHGKIKTVDGKTVAKLLEDTKAYLKRIDKLFKEIEKRKVKEEVKDLYEKTCEDCHAALAMVAVPATKKDLLTKFKSNLVDKKLSPSRYYTLVRKIEELNKSLATTREDIASLAFEQDKLAKDTFNLIRAEHGQKIEKFKVSAQYNEGKNTAAVWLFTENAFIIRDINDPNTSITRYTIDKDGSLSGKKKATLAEIEKKLKSFAGTPTTMTKKTIDSLKTILSDDVKIVIGA